MSKHFSRVTNFISVTAVIWTIILGSSLAWNTYTLKQDSFELAATQARASFEKDIVYRTWCLKHGGVYVPVTDETPPNPYLTYVDERDVLTPSGRVLTLMNPAYMGREVYEIGRQHGGAVAHISSPHPMNPKNEADQWERKAFARLEAGEKEALTLDTIDGDEYMRIMHPLVVKAECLKCHTQHGYKEGDIRGGISISVPMAPFRVSETRGVASLFIIHLFLWGIGLAGIVIGGKRIQGKVEALQASEEKYRSLVEKMLDGFALHEIICDEKGNPVDYRFLNVNPAFEALTGLSSTQIIGKTVLEVLPDTEPSWIRRYGRVALTGEGLRFEEHSAGLGKWFEIVVFRTEPGRFACLFRDISSRKQSEEELKASEERFKVLFERAPDPYYLRDLEGRFVDGNKAFEENSGYGREELIGKSFIEAGLITVEERPRVMEILAKNAAGLTSGPDEFVIRKKNGGRVDFEIRTYPTTIKGQPLVLGIARDITERKLAESERKKLETQLRQSQKMEAIGTLAGGIAHDFNNILAAILGYSELALMELPIHGTAADSIENVKEAACRARDVVRQILAFSHQTEQERKKLKITSLVKEVLKLVRVSIPSNIEIETFLNAKNDWILADASQMHQVLMNLCTNAWQAMKDKGTGVLSVGMEEVEVGAELARTNPSLKEGSYLEVAISDNGCGIPSEILDRVFEPYFTTKKRGDGTGLGLAVAQGIVSAHGGVIKVESEVG